MERFFYIPQIMGDVTSIPVEVQMIIDFGVIMGLVPIHSKHYVLWRMD
jgi:hypothetical protein